MWGGLNEDLSTINLSICWGQGRGPWAGYSEDEGEDVKIVSPRFSKKFMFGNVCFVAQTTNCVLSVCTQVCGGGGGRMEFSNIVRR